ncbi:MAG: AraC family transcriptional regulator [Sphingobacterium sp.]|jgi:AraC-like DNA-binding protein|nr:AraC family transcriptional regulator [Sphingobacterium sp.]
MEQDYKLKFSKAILRIKDVTGNLPDFCRHPIPMAKKAMLYELQGATLLQQTIPCDTFRIDIFQLDSHDPMHISYTLDQGRIFFNFVLFGAIVFKTDQGEHITSPSACSLYLSAEQQGGYHAECPRGSTELVVISLLPSWISAVVDKYPTLSKAVSFLLESNNRFDVLPHCSIDSSIRQWLFGVHAFNHDNIIAQQGELQKYLAMSLAHYEELLVSSDDAKIYEIKQYIDQHYNDPDLDIKVLTDQIGLSFLTINRKFKKAYRLSMRNYCIQVRMQQAHRLILTDYVRLKDAHLLVGYNNENSFRKAYKKFLSHYKKIHALLFVIGIFAQLLE